MEKLSKYRVTYFLLVVVMTTLLAPIRAAAQFRFEGTGSYANLDSPFSEQDRYSGSISWFPWAVDESKGPLAEAAFLSRSSSFRYSYRRTEDSSSALIEVVPQPGVDTIGFGTVAFNFVDFGESNTDTHFFGTRYVVADTPWIVGSGVSVSDGGFSVGDTSNDQDDWSGALSVGYYVLTNTTVSFRGEYAENDTTSLTRLTFDFPVINLADEFFSEVEFETEFESETFDFSLIGEHVGNVGRYNYRLTANVGYFSTDIDVVTAIRGIDAATGEPLPFEGETNSEQSLGTRDGWRTGILGTWYINDRIGLSANYQFSELANQQTHSYGVGASWFVTRYLEVSGNYLRSDTAGPFSDLEQWVLSVRGRF